MGTQRPRQVLRGRARARHPDSSSVLILLGPTPTAANRLYELRDLKPNQLQCPMLPEKNLGPGKGNDLLICPMGRG